MSSQAPRTRIDLQRRSAHGERFLDGRAVLARSDGLWYRVRKFAARNAVAVTAAPARVCSR